MNRRRPLIAGNWKMHLGPVGADKLATAIRQGAIDKGLDSPQIELAVFPPFLSIPATVARLRHTGVQVGGQDLHPEVQGAFTGAVSGEMLRESGCTYVLVGHSERRTLFGDTDGVVGLKVKAAVRAGLLPVLCVGETLPQREAGQVEAVVTNQLTQGLGDLPPDQVAAMVIAYEPVWAIGTGVTASPDQAQEVHALIRAFLNARYPAFVGGGMRLLYGGSVKPANARALLGQEDIDGALIGGASLVAEDFLLIAEAAPRA